MILVNDTSNLIRILVYIIDATKLLLLTCRSRIYLETTGFGGDAIDNDVTARDIRQARLHGQAAAASNSSNFTLDLCVGRAVHPHPWPTSCSQRGSQHASETYGGRRLEEHHDHCCEHPVRSHAVKNQGNVLQFLGRAEQNNCGNQARLCLNPGL